MTRNHPPKTARWPQASAPSVETAAAPPEKGSTQSIQVHPWTKAIAPTMGSTRTASTMGAMIPTG